jgi:hypothetical protein
MHAETSAAAVMMAHTEILSCMHPSDACADGVVLKKTPARFPQQSMAPGDTAPACRALFGAQGLAGSDTSAVQCSAVQCSAVQCSAVQWVMQGLGAAPIGRHRQQLSVQPTCQWPKTPPCSQLNGLPAHVALRQGEQNRGVVLYCYSPVDSYSYS